MPNQLKRHPAIGCCGIDCGLCPRFHTKGDSACPGCGGPDFREKHPSCGFLTCCFIKKRLEVCSGCPDYPCKRFEPERQGYDSFVTHRKIFFNLDQIKEKGMEIFIDQQKIRMDLLNDFIIHYDDGRSRSFFCLSCALLPVDKLMEAQASVKKSDESIPAGDKNKLLKNKLLFMADQLGISLRLNHKPKI